LFHIQFVKAIFAPYFTVIEQNIVKVERNFSKYQKLFPIKVPFLIIFLPDLTRVSHISVYQLYILSLFYVNYLYSTNAKTNNNSLLQVVSLSVAISLSLLLLESLSLLALISQFTRVFGVNPQTSLVTGMFFQPPELQLCCKIQVYENRSFSVI